MIRVATALPESVFNPWFKRAAPTMGEAIALAQRVAERMGDRVRDDGWHGREDRALFELDQGWAVPVPLMRLEVGAQVYLPTYGEGVPRPERLQLTSTVRRSGRLTFQEGRRIAQISYAPDGVAFEWMRSSGDARIQRDGAYFYGIDDGLLVHDQPAPSSLLARGDLDPDGETLDGIAAKVAELDARGDVPARVWMPAPCPGGYGGVFGRALWELRKRIFAGTFEVPDEAWMVVDGWDLSAVGGGESLDVAFANFRAAVGERCPKPPPNATPEQKAEIREALAEMGDDPGPGPVIAAEVETKGGKTRLSTGPIAVRMVPPKVMDWPERRPENVPAIAIPLPPRPRVPDPLQVMGFSRTLRLFDDLGGVAHGFLRSDPRGHTFVGERAAALVRPGSFEDELRALDQGSRGDYGALDGRDWFAPHPEYPWRVMDYQALSNDKRSVGPLRSGGISLTAEVDGAALDAGATWRIFRATRTK